MPGRITTTEYARIKELVASEQVKTTLEKRRDELRLVSEARVERWPNTLQAVRKQKETAFVERKERKEAAQLAIDREEDEKRARARRKKIEYASKTIHQATQKMKRLQSAEILVDCLHGRRQQLELNSRLKVLETQWEKQFLEMDRERLHTLKAREDKETSERSSMARDIAGYQKEQLAEVKARYLGELNLLRAEGQAIAVRAAEEEKEDRQAALDKIAKARSNAADISLANKRLHEIRDKQNQLEAEEDARTQAYAQRKEELTQRQKAQAERIELVKHQKRQAMIDEGVRRLAAMKKNDDQRIENQAADARAAEDKFNRNRDEKRAEFARQIKGSRDRQLERRSNEKTNKVRNEQEFAKQWRNHNYALEQQEKDEKRAEFRAAQEHQEFLRVQMHEKRMREMREVERDGEATELLISNLAQEENEFYELARVKAEQFVAEGKNPYPVLKAVADVKKEKKTIS